MKERGEWRARCNKNMYLLYRSPDIITSNKISRLRWAGYLKRMSKEHILRRIMDCKPEERRRTGRPKLRWVNGVLEDIKKLGAKNWWRVSRNGEAWRSVLRKAEVRIRL